MRRRHRPTATGAAILLALLAGCGQGEPQADPHADLTEPGTTLELGDRAVVRLGEDEADGIVELTVTDVDRGQAGGATEVEGIPYFVHLEVSVVGGEVDYVADDDSAVVWRIEGGAPD